MPSLTIYKDNYVDQTVVSNLFIDEYMGSANDAQLKVYLYLLRMMSARQATSVPDIADKFNHTEKEVMRALRYWEKQGILNLDYDTSKNLVGIHIRDLSSLPAAEAEGIFQAAATFVPAPAALQEQAAPAPRKQPSQDLGKAAPTSEKAAYEKTAFEKTAFEKPSYSADQLREFKNRQDTAQLLFIAESYIGKPLTPAEIKTILYFTDVLHFSDDLIDYLIQYCVDKGKKDFKYIEKVAVNWAEAGISTPKEAQKNSCRYDKNVYTIMNSLGKEGSPTAKEMEYINRWLKEYCFTTDIIIEACSRTVLATDKHRFEYAEGILCSWKRQNVHHKSDIARIDDMYQQRKKNTAPPKQASNRFNQFAQNSYDFDALEQELISN